MVPTVHRFVPRLAAMDRYHTGTDAQLPANTCVLGVLGRFDRFLPKASGKGLP